MTIRPALIRLSALALSAALALMPQRLHAQPAPAEESGLRLATLGTEEDEDAATAAPPQDMTPELLKAPPAPPRPAVPEEDPYTPLGIRLGAFFLFPSLEARLGHTDNFDQSTSDPAASRYRRLLPELEVRSNWIRHELRGRVAADYRAYDHQAGDETTGIDAELAGRIDITSVTAADLRLGYSFDPESRSDPNEAIAVVEPADSESLEGEAALRHDMGRLRLSGRAAVAKKSYDDSVLTDGTVEDNGDRSYLLSEAAVRASFELVEDTALFVETGANRRRYDRGVDENGVIRGSRGFDVLAGAEFRMTGLLTGELGAGYQRQFAEDPALPDIEGLIFRGALQWRPTGLTTVSLTGSVTPEEGIIDAAASGARVYATELMVEHAFRRNLIATASFGFSRADYVGSERRDDYYDAAIEVEYLANRSLSLIAEATHERFDSNLPDEDYEENRIEVGMRVRR